MKTIVFHSVKGGVGRTLALYHMALALRKAGKKVVMLDWDYSAPGLSYKCGLEGFKGYVEYLKLWNLEERAGDDERRKQQRIDSLKAKAYPVYDGVEKSEDLLLIPAGNDNSPEYWDFISSFRFHRLFYFGSDEVLGLTEKSFPRYWLELNIQAFENDKKLIEKAFNADYLLVDCKTSMETSAFALVLWSDTVIHFMPPNCEGIKFLIDTARSIVNYPVSSCAQKLTVVVSRVPPDPKEIAQQEFKKKLKEQLSKEQQNLRALLDEENLIFLTEVREVEKDETILNNAENPYYSLWSLRHEYIKLYTKVAPLTEGENQTEEKWYEVLKMNPKERLCYQIFNRLPHLGTMQNDADGQPNIAFRVATFHNLVDSLLRLIVATRHEDESTLQRNQVLEQSGFFCGKDFAQKLNEHLSKLDPLPKVKKRLEEWAAFDSGVGFGSIELEDSTFNADLLVGHFSVKGDAFRPRPTIGDNEELQDDLRSFFSGYLKGVLQYVFAEDQFDLNKETFEVCCLSRDCWPDELTLKYSKTETDVSVYCFKRIKLPNPSGG